MVAVLDLHANVSDKMIDNSTCVYAYRKNPHSDSRDAAIKAALILNDLFENPNVNQVNYKTKYILPPTGVGTANDPMKSILYEANQIEKNDNCTWFISKTSKLHARKKWIISSISPKGELTIDEGAKKALINGKSLLAAGIKRVSGKFSKGDHIKILDNKKREFARGLSSFSSEEINKIMGCHSNEIQKILGYVSKSEVVHKDDMVEI